MKKIPVDYKSVVFDAKPDAVPYNYRISYKVTQLCLIMRICGRGDTCSLIKLHMISFALISHENMRKLIEFADGNRPANKSQVPKQENSLTDRCP